MSVEGQRRFSEAIGDVIDYYSKEFNLTYAECVGVLTMTVADLSIEARDCTDEEDKDGEHLEEGDPEA